MSWQALVALLAPIILGLIPRFPKTLIPIVIAAIAEAEALPGATGPEKKAHALELIRQAILALNVVKPKPGIDVDKALALVSGGIDLVIGLIHIFKPKAAPPTVAEEVVTVIGAQTEPPPTE